MILRIKSPNKIFIILATSYLTTINQSFPYKRLNELVKELLLTYAKSYIYIKDAAKKRRETRKELINTISNSSKFPKTSSNLASKYNGNERRLQTTKNN